MNDNNNCAFANNCPQVSEAADAAVKKVFAILGVNVDVPKEVEEFRENLRFGASLKKGADRGWLVLVGGVVTVILTAIGAGVVAFVHGIVAGRMP